jgi:7,8-dihydroneopterin aldolase/epimerase/oxygenase
LDRSDVVSGVRFPIIISKLNSGLPASALHFVDDCHYSRPIFFADIRPDLFIMTGKITLEGLEFHAFHGVYPHERASGNWFEVDISVETDFTEGASNDELAGTVNYETLFEIVKKEMEQPSKLLETVAEKIVGQVFLQLLRVNQVDLKISKINPPIGGKCRKASISISKKR